MQQLQQLVDLNYISFLFCFLFSLFPCPCLCYLATYYICLIDQRDHTFSLALFLTSCHRRASSPLCCGVAGRVNALPSTMTISNSSHSLTYTCAPIPGSKATHAIAAAAASSFLSSHPFGHFSIHTHPHTHFPLTQSFLFYPRTDFINFPPVYPRHAVSTPSPFN